jgi:hypothetical protein
MLHVTLMSLLSPPKLMHVALKITIEFTKYINFEGYKRNMEVTCELELVFKMSST